jgi:hypothetical protein
VALFRSLLALLETAFEKGFALNGALRLCSRDLMRGSHLF